MSFLNKILKERPKDRNNDVYSGLRYPAALGDIEPGVQSLLNFNVVESARQTYTRDRSTSFGENARYIKTVQLYVPGIEESIQNNFTRDKIGFIGNLFGGENIADAVGVGVMGTLEHRIRQMAGPSAVASAQSKSIADTSTVFYESTNTRQMTFTYSFEPKSADDVSNLHEIINVFRKYALPDIVDDTSYFPKFWAIEEKPFGSNNRTMKMFKFGPAALLSVATNYTPEQVWRTFESGDPIQVTMVLTFQEIFVLSQSDIDAGF